MVMVSKASDLAEEEKQRLLLTAKGIVAAEAPSRIFNVLTKLLHLPDPACLPHTYWSSRFFPALMLSPYKSYSATP